MTEQLRIIHVDDERKSLDSFAALAKSRDYIEYLAGFQKAEEAAKFLLSHEVDIAVLDIEMEGRNGLWLAGQIKDLPVDIIFLSAHSDYALKAFEACALDFLEKPLYADKLDRCMMRYMERQKNKRVRTPNFAQVEELFQHYLKPHEFPKRLFISGQTSITVIQLDNVLYFEAEGSYTKIFVRDENIVTSTKPMKVYEDALNEHPDFVRIHRRFMINKNFVKTIIKDGKKGWVIMQDGTKLEMSALKKDEILEKLFG